MSGSIARLRELEGLLERGGEGRVKKELLTLEREKEKLELSLGGIKDMGSIPDIMFVIDTNKEAIAILEARKLNIPIIAILDTNSDPDGITYPVPGNDDAARAIQTYCDLIADAVLDGLAAGAAALGRRSGRVGKPRRADAGRGLGPGRSRRRPCGRRGRRRGNAGCFGRRARPSKNRLLKTERSQRLIGIGPAFRTVRKLTCGRANPSPAAHAFKTSGDQKWPRSPPPSSWNCAPSPASA